MIGNAWRGRLDVIDGRRGLIGLLFGTIGILYGLVTGVVTLVERGGGVQMILVFAGALLVGG
jgi:F0F1-type ATP synthase epsilon subunit